MNVRSWAPILEDAAASSHVALVYRDPEFLSAAVARWSAPALRNGGGAILVGTPTHAVLIRAELRKVGVDVDGSERNGRLVIVDADWLMANFILDGSPDAAKFRALASEIVAGVVSSAEGPSGPVRAWGEMVSLLRLRGNPGAARRLEELWAEIIAEHGIALLCSYDLEGRLDGEHGHFMSDVGHAHSHVILQPEAAEGALTSPAF